MKANRLDEIKDLILGGKLDDASIGLSEFESEEISERRTKAHYEAIIEFYRGKVERSFEMLQIARERFGDNVNLTRDIVVCQYHLQDMQAFRLGLAHLETQLIELESKLSPTSLIACELMCGKFLEEEARLAPAAQFYDRALLRSQTPAHRLRALIQKARWMALYEPLPS